jgi:hypothetical protein
MTRRDWHRWFAWAPTLTDRGWAWLRTVERKWVDGHYDSYWTHREIR